MKAKAFRKHALSWLLIVLFAILPGIFAQGSGSLAKFSQEELDQLLAPIALYPDSLLAQILLAATYPVGDDLADQAARARFEKAYGEMNQLEKKDEKRVILHMGREDWPFPIPIVKWGNSWYFDTSEGKEEILNRRIGRNELDAIQVCLAVVDAESEYSF